MIHVRAHVRRRAIGAASAIAISAAALAAGPAVAEAPTVEEIAVTDIDCSATSGRAIIDVNGTITAESVDVYVFVTTPRAFYAPDFTQPSQLTVTGDTVSGTIPMLHYGPVGLTPAGDAELALTLTPAGEPEQIRETTKPNSNETSRTVGTVQPLSVTGTVTAIGRTVDDLSGCEAERIELTTRATNPDSIVSGIRGGRTHDAHCTVGRLGSVSFAVDGKDVVGAFAVSTAQSYIEGEILDASWRPPVLSGTFRTLDDEGREIGTSTARVVRGEQIDEFTTVDTLGPFRRMYSVTAYEADGTLQLPGGDTRAMNCQLLLVTGHAALHTPSGPEPANDSPTTATPLGIGAVIEQPTGGAREDAEVGSWCGELGFTNTVWYAVTGTGDPLRFDTAGSNFDTLVAVYAGSPDDLVELACRNDNRTTRLASVTWPTEAGTVYLVQVGGSEGQSGRLSVSLQER